MEALLGGSTAPGKAADPGWQNPRRHPRRPRPGLLFPLLGQIHRWRYRPLEIRRHPSFRPRRFRASRRPHFRERSDPSPRPHRRKRPSYGRSRRRPARPHPQGWTLDLAHHFPRRPQHRFRNREAHRLHEIPRAHRRLDHRHPLLPPHRRSRKSRRTRQQPAPSRRPRPRKTRHRFRKQHRPRRGNSLRANDVRAVTRPPPSSPSSPSPPPPLRCSACSAPSPA